MDLLRFFHGIARQIGGQDPNTGSDVTQVGDSVNNAIRTSEQADVIESLTLLAPQSTSGGTTVTSADQVNPYWRGCALLFNGTVMAAGGVKIAIDHKDEMTGAYVQQNIIGSAIASTGEVQIVNYPAAGLGQAGFAFTAILGHVWRIRVIPQDTGTYTFSVSASMLR